IGLPFEGSTMTIPSQDEFPLQVPPSARPPSPGDLYGFRLDMEAQPAWLVIRAHPDDAHLLLAVPVDDFPLAGPPDVVLPSGPADPPRSARCGQALWLPAGHLLSPLRVGTVSEEGGRLVRRQVAGLARGPAVATPDQERADRSPSYENWLAAVDQARRRLQARVEEGRPLLRLAELSSVPPPELSPLPLGRERQKREAGAERYLEMPIGGGKLVL